MSKRPMKTNEPGHEEVLTGRRVLVALSGGIAAYKTVELTRRLLKRGAEIRVMMTRSAARFVHPTTFAAITGHPVGLKMFSSGGSPAVDHLELPHWAELIIVAPATANLLAKMAAGIADDLVSTALLAATCPVLVAPAMNSTMFEHPATRRNLELLRERGVRQIGPETGEMAHPDEKPGPGRMSEPEAIEREVERILRETGDFAGKRVLITSGRTEEPVDAVRVLTNRSSGRMGAALADAARRRGAFVTLVHGPMDVPPPPGVRSVPVRTAREMLSAVREEVPASDLVLYAAAVADWRPKEPSEGKLSREEPVSPVIELVENPDIARETSGLGKGLKIGFALETGEDVRRAREKLERKRLDAILLNTISTIGAEEGTLVWVGPEGEERRFGPADKASLAGWVLDNAAPRLLR